MNHALNVPLVDTHRERNCAAKDFNLVVAKLFLDEDSLVIGLASMIRSCSNSLLIQKGSDLVCGGTLSCIKEN